MDNLIDALDTEKWQETDESSIGEGYETFRVNRNHKRPDDNSIVVLIAGDDGEGINVTLAGLRPNKDPLKNVSLCDLKLDPTKKFIIGINLDGECVVCK